VKCCRTGAKAKITLQIKQYRIAIRLRVITAIIGHVHLTDEHLAVEDLEKFDSCSWWAGWTYDGLPPRSY
jgi:hypothetical protein